MNRDVERAAAKLGKLCRETGDCEPMNGFEVVEEPCGVGPLADAGEELLEELRRAGVIPAL